MAAPLASLEDFDAEMARLAAAKAGLEKKEDAARRTFEALRRGAAAVEGFFGELGLEVEFIEVEGGGGGRRGHERS